MSIFKKIPRWCWYVFPVALVLLVIYAVRSGGDGVRSWLKPPSSRPDDPAVVPGITPKVAEEKREEVKEVTEDKREKIKEEAAAMRERLNG